ncbi:MAG: EamA family transporter [Bacteroidota bacterium]|nr:EamA family transporter [Bacteroidota bacterium]
MSSDSSLKLRVHSALLFVQITFGGFSVFGKYVVGSVPPLAVAGIRVLGAAPLFLLLAAQQGRAVPPWGELPRLALLGLFGVCMNQILFIVGLSYTTATNAAILITSIPLFTLTAAALLRIEKLKAQTVQGVALAVAGALIVLDPSHFSLGGSVSFGNLLILLNCVSYSLFLVLAGRVLLRLPPITVIAWSYILGGIPVLAVSAPTLAAWSPSSTPALAWAGLLYIVLFATVVNYALNTWAIRHTSSSVVAAYTTLQPLVAATLASVFLGESIGWQETAGFVLIAGGLLRVTAPKPKR